jgi:hypothetical protein
VTPERPDQGMALLTLQFLTSEDMRLVSACPQSPAPSLTSRTTTRS